MGLVGRLETVQWHFEFYLYAAVYPCDALLCEDCTKLHTFKLSTLLPSSIIMGKLEVFYVSYL